MDPSWGTTQAALRGAESLFKGSPSLADWKSETGSLTL